MDENGGEQGEEGNGRIEPLGQAGRELDRARADGGIAHAHPARHPRVAVGGVRGVAFVAHGNVSDAGRARADRVGQPHNTPPTQGQPPPPARPAPGAPAEPDQLSERGTPAATSHGAGLFYTSERTAARISGYA